MVHELHSDPLPSHASVGASTEGSAMVSSAGTSAAGISACGLLTARGGKEDWKTQRLTLPTKEITNKNQTCDASGSSSDSTSSIICISRSWCF